MRKQKLISIVRKSARRAVKYGNKKMFRGAVRRYLKRNRRK